MFHNEWSAEAAKPLQHTTGTETKTVISDGVGTGRIGCGDSGLGTGSAPTLTVVPLAMASARILLVQIADQRRRIALPAALPVRRRDALKVSFGRNRRPGRNTWRMPFSDGHVLPNVRSANWGVHMDASRMQSRRSVSLHTGSSYHPCPPLH